MNQTTDSRYVAAVEIGSSKIIAAVGIADEKGRLTILAVEQMKGLESVRHGIIQNAEDVASRLNAIIERLERRADIAPRQIEAIFVGLAGRSMKCVRVDSSLRLPEETEITAAHLDDLRNLALESAIDTSLEIIDAIPCSYDVARTETQNPVGIIGDSISATFDLIVCRPNLKKNLLRAIKDKTGIEVANFVVTPVAVSHLILRPEEKRLGCMLVDMGAETTTVLIFKNNNIQYFATLPMGSRNITRDIISLNFLEERAEEIKKAQGCAVLPEVPSMIDIDDVPLRDIIDRIVARSEEIVANVIEQINYAGMTPNDLPGGIIAIGGGFKLSGMVDLISVKSGMSVRRGALPPFVEIDDTKAPASEIIQVGSILYAGATMSDKECLSAPVKEDLPHGDDPEDLPETPEETVSGKRGKKTEGGKPSGFGKFFGSLKGRMSSFFTGESDDDEENDGSELDDE